MASYWQRRRERADARLARAERDVAKRAARYYRDELRRLEEALAAFYAEVPADEVSAYRAALAVMDPDAERLLWEDCDEFARAHPERAWMVPVRKRLYRLTRLEGLQASARLGLARATGRVDEGLPGHFEAVAGESARAVSDALGHDVYDDATVRAFVGTPWSDGRNYSDAIWANADRLAEHVSGDLARGLARGDSYQRLCADMARRFAGQAVSDCMRVVQTEGTYVSRKVQGDAMRRAGFDRYYVDARGDERTCDTCRAVSAQSHRAPLAFDDARPGENYPPLHPRCRCDVNPAVDDWADWLRAHGDAGKRAAERFGMATTSSNKWPAHGTMMRREQFKRLREIAEAGGISLVGFRRSDADFETCRRIVSAGVSAKRRLGIRTHLTLALTGLDEDDYAGTDMLEFERIELNAAALRDAGSLARNLGRDIADGKFARMSVPEGIIYHELGHTYALERGLDPMEAARRAFPSMSDSDIMELVEREVSSYAAQYQDGTEIPSEVIAMVLSGTANSTAMAIARALGVPGGVLRDNE